MKQFNMFAVIAVAATLSVVASPAMAQVVGNAGFETPSVGSSFQFNPTGATWIFTGRSGISGNGSGFGSTAPEGVQVALLQSNTQGTVLPSFTQTINGFILNQSYVLTFKAAERASFGTQDQTVQAQIGTLTTTVTPLNNGNFTTYVFGFTANATSLALTFTGTATNTGDRTAFVDQVSITNAPEAGTFALAALGLVSFGGVAARRRTAK